MQLMKEVVMPGEELMPHRDCPVADLTESEVAAQRTPIRKFTRNRGLVMQGDSAVVDESPEFAGSVNASKHRRLFSN
jgi:non-structural maintenance of chromosomes element 4